MTATSNPSTETDETDPQDTDAADDAVTEMTDDAVAEAVQAKPLSPEAKRILELEGDLEALGAKLRTYSQTVDRMRREFEASKGRIQREHERSLAGDKVKAVTGLLGVLDDLDQAIATIDDDNPDNDGAFVAGVRMIQRDFTAALSKLGLDRFDAMGEVFDPERHEALTIMPVPDQAQHNLVVHVMKQGAMVGGKVVRAATVVVGKHAEGEATPVN